MFSVIIRFDLKGVSWTHPGLSHFMLLRDFLSSPDSRPVLQTQSEYFLFALVEPNVKKIEDNNSIKSLKDIGLDVLKAYS